MCECQWVDEDRAKKRANDGCFDEKEFKRLKFQYVNSKQKPDSSSVRELLSYINDDLPNSVTSSTMLPDLIGSCIQSSNEIKAKLARVDSLFTISVQEGKADEKYNFLAITVHYYTNEFVHESHLLGFELFEEHNCYFGLEDEIHNRVKKVIEEYGIEHAVLTITQGTNTPICSSLNYRMRWYRDNTIKLLLYRSVQCLRDALSKSANTFLKSLYFGGRNSSRTIGAFEKMNPESEDSLGIRRLPRIIRTLVNGINHDDYLKSTFKEIVDQRVETICELPIIDYGNQWISTYEMITKLLSYKDEVKRLYSKVDCLSKEEQDKLCLGGEKITDSQWEYLADIHKILEAFQFFAVALENNSSSSHAGINYTIPCVLQFSKRLEELQIEDFARTNLYIAFALDETHKSLLYQYPIHEEELGCISHLYLACVLDPRCKLGFLRDLGLSPAKIDQIKKHFFDVYDCAILTNEAEEWYREYDKRRKKNPSLNETLPILRIDPSTGHTRVFNHDEVELYLAEERLEGKTDTIGFYKDRQESFPIISQIARNYLAIPAMATPEKSFACIYDVFKENQYPSSTMKVLSILLLRDIIKR